MKNSVPPRTKPKPKKVSFVIPLYNEEETIPMLKQRLEQVSDELDCAVEWVIVNDGSYDRTHEMLFDWADDDQRVKVIDFARNFGHQAALTAGLDFASGDAVIILDGDLQDPPELAMEMIKRYEAGYDVVLAKRKVRQGESLFKRFTASFFYWFMRQLVHRDLIINEGDFCLLSRSATQAIVQFRERYRFIRGMVAWLGFSHTVVEFERSARAAGTTKFAFYKMFRFAWDAIFSFSAFPLRIATIIGVGVFVIGFLAGVYAVYCAFYMDVVRGWSSLMVLECLLGGSTLFCLGIVGEYIGRVYEEVKRRPLYIVRETANLKLQPISKPSRKKIASSGR